jgi:hypothetical protein
VLSLTTGKVLTALDAGNVAPICKRLPSLNYRFNWSFCRWRFNQPGSNGLGDQKRELFQVWPAFRCT